MALHLQEVGGGGHAVDLMAPPVSLSVVTALDDQASRGGGRREKHFRRTTKNVGERMAQQNIEHDE